MITATHDGITVATTTGTEADAQAALGMPEGTLASPDTSQPVVVADAPAATAGVEVEAPTDASAEVPAEPPAERRTSYQSRIDRLKWEAEEARRQAAREYEARVAAEAQLAEAQRRPPADDAEPGLDSFETYEEWIKAQARFEARRIARESVAQVEARVEAGLQARARVDAQQEFQHRLDVARSEFPDFDTVVSQDISISLPVKHYIETQPDGPRLAYALGREPEAAAHLASIPPGDAHKLELGVAIGALLARVPPAPPTGPGTIAVPRTHAPPPIKPVGSGATAATVPLDRVTDQTTFEKIRNQQEQEWRRSRL
jgi:hypothetical protein